MSSTLFWGAVGTLVPLMSNSLRKLPLLRRTFVLFFYVSYCSCDLFLLDGWMLAAGLAWCAAHPLPPLASWVRL